MTTTNANPQERIARETYHDAQFIGEDADGGAHYWSVYNQAVVVIEPDHTTETYVLAETPLSSLADWMEHTRSKRGWERTRVTGSLIESIDHAVSC